MRCKKLFAVLPATVFLLSAGVPAIAGDGSKEIILDERLKDHPWQDDCAEGTGKSTKRPLGFVIGPMTFTVNITIPFTQKPSQASLKPVNNKVTQKNVEKRK